MSTGSIAIKSQYNNVDSLQITPLEFLLLLEKCTEADDSSVDQETSKNRHNHGRVSDIATVS